MSTRIQTMRDRLDRIGGTMPRYCPLIELTPWPQPKPFMGSWHPSRSLRNRKSAKPRATTKGGVL